MNYELHKLESYIVAETTKKADIRYHDGKVEIFIIDKDGTMRHAANGKSLIEAIEELR